MKALEVNLVETFPFSPEDCVPYDGASFHNIYIPADTDLEAYKKELNDTIAEDEFGLAGFTISEEVELDPENFELFEGEFWLKEDLEHEKMLRDIGFYHEDQSQYAAGVPDAV